MNRHLATITLNKLVWLVNTKSICAMYRGEIVNNKKKVIEMRRTVRSLKCLSLFWFIRIESEFGLIKLKNLLFCLASVEISRQFEIRSKKNGINA